MTENKCPKDIIEHNLTAQGLDKLVVEEFTEVLAPTFSSQVFQMVWGTCKELEKYVNPADIPPPWRNIYQCMVTLGQAELFDSLANYPPKVVHGHITDHPLFSTVAYQASWLDEEQRFFYVSLQFLVVCASIEAHRIGEQVSLSAISKACLLTRQLAQSKHRAFVGDLAHIFNEFDPDVDADDDYEVLSPMVQRFCALDQYLEANKEHPFFGIKFIALKTVVATVAGYKELKQKRDRKDIVRGPVIRQSFGGDGDDALTIITDTDVDEETEYQSQEIDGCAPNEVKSPRVQIKAPLPGNMPKAWQSSRQIAYRQKGMMNAIAQRNQGLIFQVSRLQRSELQVILASCNQALTELERNIAGGPPIGFVETVDVHLAILLLLLTGMSLTDLADITLVKANDINQLHIRPAEDGSAILLSFVPPKHRLSHIKPERFEKLVHRPADYLELAVGDAFYPLLKQAFHLKRLEGVSWDQPILSAPSQALEDKVKVQLKSWNRSTNSHISINRLIGWLGQAVFEYTGDLAACYYLKNASGNKPAQAYYANYDQQQLLDIYDHVTSKAFITDPAAQANTTAATCIETTGSRLAAKPVNMPKVVIMLIDYVGTAKSALLEDKIALHNRLVSYIYLMFAFGIGIRSVIDPLESINNVDLHSGCMLLNDKENRSVTNCRYVMLPAVLHQQIKAYRQHLKVLHALLKGCNHALSCKVKAAIYGDDNTPMLFLVNADRKLFERVTPKKLTGKLASLLPLPLNMGRHYLRSELVRRHCPVYWIDAMLGHAEIGVEANSRYSALSFTSLKRLTAEFLEPLVKQADWKVLTGLGNKHG
jgi:hypothetical protein